MYKIALVAFLVFFLVSIGVFLNTRPKSPNKSEAQVQTPEPSGTIASNSNLTFQGDVKVEGNMQLDVNKLSYAEPSGRVLSIDTKGKLVLVPDQEGSGAITNITQYKTTGVTFPTATDSGTTLYYDGSNWKANTNLFNGGSDIGIYTTNPQASLMVQNNDAAKIAFIVQGYTGQTNSLTEWRDANGVDLTSIDAHGKLTINNSSNGHSIELTPTGDSGYLSSSGGVIFINNTQNLGSGIGIYSNAGADALGNMINIKVDNTAYAQAAFYMNYDGSSNAVEIVSNGTDSSSNALAVTGYNPNDSTVGIIGYETGRGTIKVSHNGTGSDSNASGLSIDLKGTGTRSQGIYVDSTATAGTLGNLLRLRNQTIDRFVVDKAGSLAIGGYGTDTSITKYGNTTNDQFFVGTNGAFRIQRSATDSEAFRTQVAGDIQGRWLGTSDGKLKFGSGSALQDTVLQRIGVGILQVDSGLSVTTNLGVGATTFDATGDNILTLLNGTAPAASVIHSVQLWAENVASSSELRVRDEAGNITTLSPHNFSLIPGGASEDLSWSYYSEKNNTAINVDMLAALRALESLSQKQFVYEKNLDTGQEIAPTASNVLTMNTNVDMKTKEAISEAFNLAVNKVEFEKHVTLAENVWSFISDVAFKAKSVFEKSATFLAEAIFQGPITVNADTSGSVTVPEGTKRFAVTFENTFTKPPVVYITPKSANSSFEIQNITTIGFEISLSKPLANATDFSWLALLSADSSFNHLKVLETSNVGSVVPENTTQPSPSPIPLESTPSAVLQ